MKIQPNFANVKAKQLHHPQVLDGQARPCPWSAYEKREIKHTQPANLQKDRWVICYGNRAYNDANTLYDNLCKAAGGFGVRVSDPQWVELPNDSKSDDYIKGI